MGQETVEDAKFIICKMTNEKQKTYKARRHAQNDKQHSMYEAVISASHKFFFRVLAAHTSQDYDRQLYCIRPA